MAYNQIQYSETPKPAIWTSPIKGIKGKKIKLLTYVIGRPTRNCLDQKALKLTDISDHDSLELVNLCLNFSHFVAIFRFWTEVFLWQTTTSYTSATYRQTAQLYTHACVWSCQLQSQTDRLTNVPWQKVGRTYAKYALSYTAKLKILISYHLSSERFWELAVHGVGQCSKSAVAILIHKPSLDLTQESKWFRPFE